MIVPPQSNEGKEGNAATGVPGSGRETLYAPRLDVGICGVDFRIEHHGREIPCLITAEHLCAVYGSDDSPEGWLECFMTHQAAILKEAMDRFRLNRPPFVILMEHRRRR